MSAEDRPKAQLTNRILAIDGPAGAGKSTVAAQMATRFNLLNLETGAMYRAFALKALGSGIAFEDSSALHRLSKQTTIELVSDPHQPNQVILDGKNVTPNLRTAAIAEAASKVSIHAPVRAWMVHLQQQMGLAAPQGVVMEGRDIGTVVFPQASIKVFLSASHEARAERRLAQDGDASREAVLTAIRARDQRDSSRTESPLRPAPDAIQIDSTNLDLQQVIEQVASLIAQRWELPRKAPPTPPPAE